MPQVHSSWETADKVCVYTVGPERPYKYGFASQPICRPQLPDRRNHGSSPGWFGRLCNSSSGLLVQCCIFAVYPYAMGAARSIASTHSFCLFITILLVFFYAKCVDRQSNPIPTYSTSITILYINFTALGGLGLQHVCSPYHWAWTEPPPIGEISNFC